VTDDDDDNDGVLYKPGKTCHLSCGGN